MRPMLMALFLCAALAGLGGCAWGPQLPITPVSPPPGFVFEQIKAPLTVNYHHTPISGERTGRAMTRYLAVPFYPILSVAWHDKPSVETAAENGGLTQVDYADYEVMSVFGIYTEFTVVAHGK